MLRYVSLLIIITGIVYYNTHQARDALLVGLIAVVIDVIIGALTHEAYEDFDSHIRLNNTVYSGDIITLKTRNQILQREKNHSQLRLGQGKSNLSKLRFENLDNEGPLRYGQEVYIKHNALIDNKNQVRFIKYGERLNSHQEGSVYNLFKLINKAYPQSTRYVNYGDQFTIACADQEGDKVFLKLEKGNSISPEGTFKDAIVWHAVLQQPYTENNLCIKPNESLYP